MKAALLISAATALLLLSACASQGEAGIMKDQLNPDYKGGKGTRLLVFVASRDPGLRQDAETAFVIDGVQKNLSVKPSYTILPQFKDVTKERLAEVVKSEGCDRVLLVRTVPNTAKSGTHSYYSDYYMNLGAYSDMYGSWYGTATSVYTPVDPPPGFGQYTNVKIETLLYDATSAALIWNATSDITTSRYKGDTLKKFVDVNLSRLQSKGLL